MGVGGSGAVYRCTYSANGNCEKVAAKVVDVRGLKLCGSYDRERDKLRREVAILASLSHEGVVNLHGVLDTTDRLILIMDLVEGGELFSFVANRGCLSENQARYVFIQLAQTLLFLHSEGVIHRDLKLENILVAKEVADGYFNVRIADFGLSKILAGNYTVAKSYVGTPQYWAPEVITGGIDGDIGYSFAADIWSLGCILYVLVAGTYPFEAGEEDILRGNFHFKYPRFSTVSEECKALIRKMLRVNPMERITLIQILNDAWVVNQPSEGPAQPKLSQTLRKPIMLNVGPTIVGSKPQTAITEYRGLPTEISPVRDASVLSLVNKFCDASTLLNCLARIFYGFHQAYLIFRCQAHLSPHFEKFLTKYKDIIRDTQKTFKKFGGTCVSVLETLRDISEILDLGRPKLAWELFITVKDWTRETVEDGCKMNLKFRDLTNEAFRLVLYSRDVNSSISEQKMLAILPPHSQSTKIIPMTSPTDATKFIPEGEVYMTTDEAKTNASGSDFVAKNYTQERESLFEAVQAIDPTSRDPAPINVCNRLLDFLFVSPEVVETNFRECPVNVDLRKTKEGPSVDEISALIRGVKELQTVNDMLEQCSAFWDNLDITLDLMKKFRDQTEILMQNEDSIERLRVRLKKYQSFWTEFHHQCQLFVDGSSLQISTMTKFTNAFNETLVRMKHQSPLTTKTTTPPMMISSPMMISTPLISQTQCTSND